MGGPGCGKTVFALQSLVNGARRDEGGGHLRRLRGEHAPDRRQRRHVRLGSARARKEEALLPRCAPLAGRREGRRVRSDRHARRPARPRPKRSMPSASSSTGSTCCWGCSTIRSPSAGRSIASATGSSQTGLTGIITQKVGGHDVDQRYGFLQFMVDCVVVLRHQVVDGSAFRNLRVMKYRGSGFAGDEFPITLTKDGLQLTNRGPTELAVRGHRRADLVGAPASRQHAARRLPPRQQRPHLRRARHRQVDAGRALRRRRLRARRAHAVRELRRRRGADRPQSRVGRHSTRARI